MRCTLLRMASASRLRSTEVAVMAASQKLSRVTDGTSYTYRNCCCCDNDDDDDDDDDDNDAART